MLNAHEMCHTSPCQFKCMDCAFQTRYRHSLEVHLGKYNHRRAPGTGLLSKLLQRGDGRRWKQSSR
ncbi:CBN-HBL-1 protein [Aphelenchoides avenae]|nr:CBN-HBL-1 protein [Aphelenchus avenae]